MIHLIKSYGDGLQMVASRQPQHTACSVASILSRVPNCYTRREALRNANSLYGLFSMTEFGQRKEGKGIICRMMTAALYVTKNLKPSRTCSSPAHSQGRFGSVCLAIGTGSSELHLLLNPAWQIGGQRQDVVLTELVGGRSPSNRRPSQSRSPSRRCGSNFQAPRRGQAARTRRRA